MDDMLEEDDDVQFEDEWEVVGPAAPRHAAGDGSREAAGGGTLGLGADEESGGLMLGGSGDITITLEDPNASAKRAVRTFTREQREAAVLAHRAHALCLLARCVAHDAAASSPELQAKMLSLLDPDIADSAAAAAARDDADASWAGGVVRWLRSNFRLASVNPPGVVEGGGGGGGSGGGGGGAVEDVSAALAAALGGARGRRGAAARGRVREMLGGRESVDERVARAAAERAGSGEQLNALLVALLRGLGLLVRTAWALDAVPFRPAQAEAAIIRQLSGAPPPPRAASSPAPGAGGGGGGGGGGSPGLQRAPSGKKRPRSAPAAAAEDADSAGGPPPAGAARGEGGGSGGKRGRGRGARGRGRGRGGGGGARAGSEPAEPPAAAAEGAEGAADAAEGGAAAAGAKRRRGDEELDREIEMAIAATAAAADAAAAAAARGGAAAPGPPPAGRPPLPGGAPRRLSSAPPGTAAAWASGGAAAPRWWAEVYCGSAAAGQWVPVDAVANWWGQPDPVDRGTAREQPLSYVVAVQGGAPKDVTRRYAANYVATLKQRDEEWWGATMRALRSTAAHLPPALRARLAAAGAAAGPAAGAAAAAGASDAAATAAAAAAGAEAEAARERARREDAELARVEAAHQRGVPRTIEGFKGHALYMLARHIGKYQAVPPTAKPLGIHGGKEPFYDRSLLSDLHTAERWRREHWRAVREEELGRPAKVVKKRAPPGAGRRAANTELDEMAAELDGQPAPPPGAEAPTTALYGHWQTEPWEPPAAEGGRVPRNERGNVEAPPFAKALPRGTRHVVVPGAAPVCRQLGVDFAPALVGFEPQGGRMVPRFEGIVVCEESAQLVLDALAQQRADREAKAAKARRRAVERAWLQLVRTMWRRLEMDREFDRDPNKSLTGGTYSDGGGGGARARAAAPAGAEEAAGGGGGGNGGGGGKGGRRTAKGAVEALRQEAAAEGGGGGGGGGAAGGRRRGGIVGELRRRAAAGAEREQEQQQEQQQQQRQGQQEQQQQRQGQQQQEPGQQQQPMEGVEFEEF